MERILKISELNENIKIHNESTDLFRNINVKGEISNLTFNKAGHIYFSLKDKEARIDCAIWKSNTQEFLKLNVKEGSEVVSKGSLTFYKPTGKFTFTIYQIRIDGIGLLAIEYDKRFQELKQEGWFDQENKINIPKFPQNIGIVTAATGDAVKDLITTIKRRFPPVNIFIFPAQVQGEGSAKDIAKKIHQANNFTPKLDTLIIGRGGGSYEDLWSFNEMEVLKAIRQSNIPIITGIGHEPDITLSDYVADFRASTPTAAGEKSTPDIHNVINSLNSISNEFAKNLNSKIEKIHLEINNYSHKFISDLKIKYAFFEKEFMNLSIYFNSLIKNKINLINQNFNNDLNNWKRNITYKFETNKNLLKSYKDRIELQSPYLPLSKGYAILKQNNHVIKSIQQIDTTKQLTAILNDGEIQLNTIKGD